MTHKFRCGRVVDVATTQVEIEWFPLDEVEKVGKLSTKLRVRIGQCDHVGPFVDPSRDKVVK